MSYLVRLWQTKVGHEIIWRASIEDSQTGERQGFTSLDALFGFLRQQTDTVMEPDGGQHRVDEQ
jgi:hypothetical protein